MRRLLLLVVVGWVVVTGLLETEVLMGRPRMRVPRKRSIIVYRAETHRPTRRRLLRRIILMFSDDEEGSESGEMVDRKSHGDKTTCGGKRAVSQLCLSGFQVRRSGNSIVPLQFRLFPMEATGTMEAA